MRRPFRRLEVPDEDFDDETEDWPDEDADEEEEEDWDEDDDEEVWQVADKSSVRLTCSK
jgi:hypothetical protein